MFYWVWIQMYLWGLFGFNSSQVTREDIACLRKNAIMVQRFFLFHMPWACWEWSKKNRQIENSWAWKTSSSLTLQNGEPACGSHLEKGSLLDIHRSEIASEKAFSSCFHLCWLAMSSCILGKQSLYQFSWQDFMNFNILTPYSC